MLDLAEGFAYCPLPGPGGVGLITQSGGTAVMMADRAEELGLAVPTLTQATQQALRGVLPPYASFGNPVDASMQAVADPSLLGKGLAAMLDDPQVGVGIVWLQHMDAKADVLVEMFTGLKQQLAKPWIVAWAAAPQKAVDELRKRGVCVVGSAETAVDIAHGLASYAEARRRHASAPAKALPPANASHAGPVASIDAAKLLEAHGVPLARALLATSPQQAEEIAAAFPSAVALKIESPDLPHKTDVGGVRLGLRGAEEIRRAFDEIVASAKQAAPQARIDGVLVQEMSAPGVELVVGLRKDPSFGMLVMLGIGGVFVEAYRDVTFRKAPLNRETAQSMVRDLRGQRLLGEFRGRAAVDQERIVQLLCAVSEFGAANAAWLEELDLNPVFARHDGAVAVDWLMIGA
jgi:acetyltransferase